MFPRVGSMPLQANERADVALTVGATHGARTEVLFRRLDGVFRWQFGIHTLYNEECRPHDPYL